MPGSCSTQELSYRDITSNLCKTAFYYQAFLLFLKPWKGEAESQRKGDIRELVQVKQRMPCKELSSALHWAGYHWHRFMWRKNEKCTSAPQESGSGGKEKQSAVQFDSNSQTFEVCCSEIVHNEAISTTMLKRRDFWARNKSKATLPEPLLLKSHQNCCWSVFGARDLASSHYPGWCTGQCIAGVGAEPGARWHLHAGQRVWDALICLPETL